MFVDLNLTATDPYSTLFIGMVHESDGLLPSFNKMYGTDVFMFSPDYGLDKMRHFEISPKKIHRLNRDEVPCKQDGE